MVYPTLLLTRTHIPFAKLYWKNTVTVCPTLLLNGMYVANTKVYWKNMVYPTLLLDGMYVANTEVYWRIQFAPHCCWMVRTLRTLKFTERIRFTPHCCWMVHTSRTLKFTEEYSFVTDLCIGNTFPMIYCPPIPCMSRNPQFHMRSLYAYTKLPHCNQFHHQWLLPSWNQPATCKVNMLLWQHSLLYFTKQSHMYYTII